VNFSLGCGQRPTTSRLDGNRVQITDKKDPLFSEIVEEKFDAVRSHTLQLEQEAEAEWSGANR
jgi:hypothetical protein